MRAAINNEKYIQQFPIDSDHPMYVKEIDARTLWNKIIHNAWKSAEPGVLFWDTIIRESIPDCYADEGFRTVSTNPCGEIPLCPYDSCRLLALNLYSYVDNPFTPQARFNFDKFRSHVEVAMRMMDDIIDLELEKIDQIYKQDQTRPRGSRHPPRGALPVGEDPRESAQGTPYGSGHYGRGRHAGSSRTDLRYRPGHRLRRRGTEDAGSGGLPHVGQDGPGARRLPDVRQPEGGGQPDDRTHPRSRSGRCTRR